MKDPTDMYDLHVKILSFKRKQIQTRIVGLMNELERIQSKNESIDPMETGLWDAIVRRNYYGIKSTLSQSKYPSNDFELNLGKKLFT